MRYKNSGVYIVGGCLCLQESVCATLYDECASPVCNKPIEKVEIDVEMAPQVNKLLHSFRLEHLDYLSSSSCSLRISDLFMK